MYHYLFYILTSAFIFGVAFSLQGTFNFEDILIFIPIFLCVFILKSKEVKIVSCLTLVSLLFGIWHTNNFIENHKSSLINLVGEKVTLTGIIDDEPDVRENLTIYMLFVAEHGEMVRIFAPHYPKFNYGDEVSVSGKLDKPENFKSENGVEFNYIGFLYKDDVYTTMYQPKVILLNSPAFGGGIKGYLFTFKHWLIDNIYKNLPSPHAPLAAGLILGAKQSLGEDLLVRFRKVGLIHVVVLSGYNITIIIEALKRSLVFLPRIVSFYVSIVCVLMFSVMTGLSATIIRASIMALIVLYADFINKRYAVNRALFLAGVIMIYFNPRILLYDPGFQLSFVATLALVHLGKRFESVLQFLPERFGIREITSSTIATQVAVLPLIISMTREVSVVALAVNLLVLPTVPLSMLFGFIPSLMFFNIPIINSLISFPAYVLLSYQIYIVKWFSELPFAVWVL